MFPFPLLAPPYYAAPVPYAPPHPAQPLYYVAPMRPPPPPPPPGVVVRPVWAGNVDAEFALLQRVVPYARYAAINVHYPGVVHGVGENHNVLTAEERYQTVKRNVDALKPLQVGIAICDYQGGLSAWEFNLGDFDRTVDQSAPNSIAYLAGRGLDFDVLRRHGIPAATFAQKLFACGLISLPGLSWITYTGAYHVAYFIKVITGDPLPQSMAQFLSVLEDYLGDEVYDVAILAASCDGMPRGLERIAGHLGLPSPLWSPGLAGAAGVRALLAFLIVKHGELRETFCNYRGLLQGLQIT